MSNAKSTRMRICQGIVWRILPVWLLWLGMTAAGCVPMPPATSGGAPLSPTPDLTATAAAVLLDQALADMFATSTDEAKAMITVTTTNHAQPPAATTAPTMTATPEPTATSTPDLAATGTAMASMLETAVAASLTAQPTHTPTTTPSATPTRDGTATAHALATTVSAQVKAMLAARPTPTPLSRPAATDTTAPPPTQPPPVICTISVAGELSGLWNQAELGCPTGGSSIVWSSWTPYERGMMMWRSDTNHVYGFFDSGWWQAVPDVWDGQSATPSRGAPPPGLIEPIRGTGYIWGTNDTFFNELGWSRAEQKGFCALVQSFERGFILRSSTVATCKDNLFNHAQGGGFPLDTLVAVQGGGWLARLR